MQKVTTFVVERDRITESINIITSRRDRDEVVRWLQTIAGSNPTSDQRYILISLRSGDAVLCTAKLDSRSGASAIDEIAPRIDEALCVIVSGPALEGMVEGHTYRTHHVCVLSPS